MDGDGKIVYEVKLIDDMDDFNNKEFIDKEILYKLGTGADVNEMINSNGTVVDYLNDKIKMCNRNKYYGNYKVNQAKKGEVNQIIEMIGVVNIPRFEHVFYKLGKVSNIKINGKTQLCTKSNCFGGFNNDVDVGDDDDDDNNDNDDNDNVGSSKNKEKCSRFYRLIGVIETSNDDVAGDDDDDAAGTDTGTGIGTGIAGIGVNIITGGKSKSKSKRKSKRSRSRKSKRKRKSKPSRKSK